MTLKPGFAKDETPFKMLSHDIIMYVNRSVALNVFSLRCRLGLYETNK